ncbi:hypothetical protein Zmor_024265 [Zophobas morio]|uniref:Uncharacterized protein n=1 Tax=Zophobas morio TaxID=2755281 RepID=A0AA38M866_9CUCU|nr:hypothetical protein Zmor_024265 [Zophobas morio]
MVCDGTLRQVKKKEMERERLLPDMQAGFREGRGTMDNVYILYQGRNSRYNDRYLRIVGEEEPQYLTSKNQRRNIKRSRKGSRVDVGRATG